MTASAHKLRKTLFVSRDHLLYLEDIESGCKKVIRYTGGLSFDEFLLDEKTFDAVLRNLEIIGEAVKHIPDEIRERSPDISWREIAGMRNFIAHVYFALDLEVLWNVIQVEVPTLLEAIHNAIALEASQEHEGSAKK